MHNDDNSVRTLESLYNVIQRVLIFLRAIILHALVYGLSLSPFSLRKKANHILTRAKYLVYEIIYRLDSWRKTKDYELRNEKMCAEKYVSYAVKVGSELGNKLIKSRKVGKGSCTKIKTLTQAGR